MSKLFELKEWLTIPEAAKHLSGILKEEVTEANVLRLAIDGHLKPSIRFLNFVEVKNVSMCLKEEAELVAGVRMTNNPTTKEQDRFEFWLCILLRSDYNNDNVQQFEVREARELGVWSIVMNDSAKVIIEREYEEMTSGRTVYDNFGWDWLDCGLIIRGERGDYRQVQSVEVSCDIENGEQIVCVPERYLPCASSIVISTEALREFEASLIDSPVTIEESPEQRMERIGTYVDKMYAAGGTKEDAHKALAKIDGCGIQAIKNVYKRYRKNDS
jgi:hypothetical protein